MIQFAAAQKAAAEGGRESRWSRQAQKLAVLERIIVDLEILANYPGLAENFPKPIVEVLQGEGQYVLWRCSDLPGSGDVRSTADERADRGLEAVTSARDLRRTDPGG